MRCHDLNVDIGEGFPHDGALLDLATSANICCGEHAGSWELTVSTVERCRDHGVRIGIHPGFPDRASMGRRVLSAAEIDAAQASLVEQTERFLGVAPDAAYIKPHGAFYTMAMASRSPERDAALATLCAVLEVCRLPLMTLEGTPPSFLAAEIGVGVIAEGFADRAYLPDGTLVPRGEPGAILEDAAAIEKQVARLADRVDSICLHGDNPDCVEFARLVRGKLTALEGTWP